MKNLFLVFLVLPILQSSAQQSYGTVGKQKIDPMFIETVQLLNPDFALTPNADAFKQRLEKNYVLIKAHADEARKQGLDKDPTVMAQMELIKQLAVDKLLNFLITTRKQETIPVTEAECKSYYTAHTNEFTDPGQYSYLKAYLYDTSKATIQTVKQKLETYSKDESQLDEFKMGNKQSFVLSFEKKRTVYSSEPAFAVLNTLPVKKVSPLIDENGMKVMYCVTSKTNAVKKPYEEVKDICKSNVENQKRMENDRKIKNAALANYPIQLNDSYFGK